MADEDLSLGFTGGLGDIIIRIYRTGDYTYLDTIKNRIFIVLGTNNPFAIELFRWHVSNKYFVIVDLSHLFLANCRKELNHRRALESAIQFSGLPKLTEINTSYSRPIFYAHDNVESRGHIVFQPFAGKPEREIPRDVCSKLMNVFSKCGRTVYVVTRSYLRLGNKRDIIIHSEEVFNCPLPKNVHVVSHLSVPATLRLVQRSHLFVGGDSALIHAAWGEGIPSVYLTKKNPTTPGRGYFWGSTKANCYHSTYNDVCMNRVNELAD